MSRRDRRAALARGKPPSTANLTELAAEATLAVQQGRSLDAEVLCKQTLAVEPRQPTALNIMGLLYRASGNHRLAAKSLAKAVAANAMDAACHYNLATSYQALGQRADAARHYRTAIALGLSGRGPEPFLLQGLGDHPLPQPDRGPVGAAGEEGGHRRARNRGYRGEHVSPLRARRDHHSRRAA